MKISVSFPVTPENYSQCWDSMDSLRRKARRSAAIARIGGYFAVQLFLISVLFLAHGVIFERLDGSYCDFLAALPGFLPLWNKISNLLTPGNPIWKDIAILAVIAYGFGIVVFLGFAGLVTLLYHPRQKKLPEGAFEENTEALAAITEEARVYSVKTKIVASPIATVVTVFAAFVLLFAYMFKIQDPAAVTRVLGQFPFQDISVNCLLYVLLAYILCGWICEPLLLVTRPLYRFNFPMDYVVQAQSAALLAKEGPLDAAAIREEAIAEEKKGFFSEARKLLRKAALLGDAAAMEHYARHCLLARMNDSARYWLDRCIAQSNSASAKKMRLRLRLGLKHNAAYLKADQAPPSTGKKVLTGFAAAGKLLWRVLILAVLAGTIWLMVIFFQASTDPGYQVQIPEALKPMFALLQGAMNDLNENVESYIPEEVSRYQIPEMVLTAEGTKWEGSCVLNDANGKPVIFCYGKDLGGDLAIPYYMEEGQKIGSVGLYTGNQWDIRNVKKYVTCLPQTKTLVVAQDFLMGLEPGEYFLIVDQGQYLPLLVMEESNYCTPQRGMAAQGNQDGWIVNDLEKVQDIFLPFYNLGSDKIIGVTETRQMAMLPKPTETELDASCCTISEDGHSITLLTPYLQQQEVGSFFDLKLQLESGDVLDMKYPHIGTAQGEFTGLMEITGKDSYSLSKGGDYTASYSFGLEGTLMNLNVSSDSRPDIITENDQSILVSEYVDFDNHTITIPEEILQEALVQGESFRIGIGYTTGFSQFGYASIHIAVKR